MIVNMEDVESTAAYIERINKANLYELKIYRDGKLMQIDKTILDEWKFTGLSNYYLLEIEKHNKNLLTDIK